MSHQKSKKERERETKLFGIDYSFNSIFDSFVLSRRWHTRRNISKLFDTEEIANAAETNWSTLSRIFFTSRIKIRTRTIFALLLFIVFSEDCKSLFSRRSNIYVSCSFVGESTNRWIEIGDAWLSKFSGVDLDLAASSNTHCWLRPGRKENVRRAHPSFPSPTLRQLNYTATERKQKKKKR